MGRRQARRQQAGCSLDATRCCTPITLFTGGPGGGPGEPKAGEIREVKMTQGIWAHSPAPHGSFPVGSSRQSRGRGVLEPPQG